MDRLNEEVWDLLLVSWNEMFGYKPDMTFHSSDRHINRRSFRINGWLALYVTKGIWCIELLPCGKFPHHLPCLKSKTNVVWKQESLREAIVALLSMESHRLAHVSIGRAEELIRKGPMSVFDSLARPSEFFEPSPN
jgi:hypothetical protein